MTEKLRAPEGLVNERDRFRWFWRNVKFKRDTLSGCQYLDEEGSKAEVLYREEDGAPYYLSRDGRPILVQNAILRFLNGETRADIYSLHPPMHRCDHDHPHTHHTH